MTSEKKNLIQILCKTDIDDGFTDIILNLCPLHPIFRYSQIYYATIQIEISGTYMKSKIFKCLMTEIQILKVYTCHIPFS